jgi:hypothetical protein
MPRAIRSPSSTILVATITCSFGLLVVAASTPAQGEACSYLSKTDASAALGETAQGPKATGPLSDGTGTSVSSCEFTGSGTHSIQLDVTRIPANSVTMYKAMCDQQASDGLSGLGDVACWYDATHAELHVIKGSAFLSIKLRRSGNPTEPIKAAMKKVLERLK